jgi:hypothetical protein
MAGVIDCLTGLCRHQGANVANGEVSREQALASIETLNTAGSQAGRRLPNINELVSLVDCSHAPPAPARAMYRHHLPDAIYRSLTSSRYEPDRAWALPVDGGAMGVGHRQQAILVVRAVREARLTAMDLHDTGSMR